MNSVVISIDAELGWGFHDQTELPLSRIRFARQTWRRLSAIFDEYEIPTTWAIVSHLFLKECDGDHEGHPAGRQCCYREGERLPREKLWFADGLIDVVQEANVAHELASHGFTHVHFDHDRMHKEFAAEELESSVAAGDERGLALDSFVFPVNRVGYRDLLAEYEFTCYRGRCPSRQNRRQKLVNAVGDRGVPPIVVPEVDEYGLVNVPASLNLFNFEGKFRSLVGAFRDDPITNRVQRGIDALTERERDGVLHLWFHPHDLTRRRDFDRLRNVLEAIDRGRDRAEIQVETMGDVAARVVDSKRRPLQSHE